MLSVSSLIQHRKYFPFCFSHCVSFTVCDIREKLSESHFVWVVGFIVLFCFLLLTMMFLMFGRMGFDQDLSSSSHYSLSVWTTSEIMPIFLFSETFLITSIFWINMFYKVQVHKTAVFYFIYFYWETINIIIHINYLKHP